MNKDTKELQERFEALLDLKTPAELVDEWIDEVGLDNKPKLSLGLGTLDNVTRGNIKGRVYAHIGYGGTRKSMFALQQLLQNSNNVSGGQTGIYSTISPICYF